MKEEEEWSHMIVQIVVREIGPVLISLFDFPVFHACFRYFLVLCLCLFFFWFLKVKKKKK